ncbi:3-phosphoglycerate dehydrogenase [Ornithobacterium rhinotracheale]|uniref:D-2-hydroxyacid dehydrogenase n=1 Tax=Ornithobacterium rhinotracheale TaxID=28251 RepID=UPI00129D1AB7|nr:D-2-hydroxyacid dehydrogenase [Ornithobacterium rhinotracheale]MRI63972.1 3-phosphoglycerate dehydrogenase [Ornithobacterium rhinotracheale]
MNILINDGISAKGGKMLQEAGFTLFTQKVPQEKLIKFMRDKNIEILLVRSATQVPMEVMEDVPSLKLIGRGGTGLDNIDVDFADQVGVQVINTPNAAAQSVAELTMAHLLGLARNLHDSNRNMPLEGDVNFNQLKKDYANAVELKGKVLGIIGYGRIGRKVAEMALGLGMRVMGVKQDSHPENKDDVTLEFYDGQTVTIKVPLVDLDDVLKLSDFITIHTPKQDRYLLDELAFSKMKDGVFIVNVARGGVMDEVALVKAIDDGKVRGAALDVFENEPNPALQILMHPQLSLSPHVGGNTKEAQDRIGEELAEQIIKIFGRQN